MVGLLPGTRFETYSTLLNEDFFYQSCCIFLKIGCLAVPHPILIRKYQQNEFTSLWFTTYIWGVLYLRNQSPPYFDAAHIRLFTISYVDA